MKTGFIDWQENSLTLYIFDKKGDNFVLLDSETIPLEGELNADTLTGIIRSGLKSIYLSLPLNILTLREHFFPFSDNDKIKATIIFELDGILLGDVNDYTIDHLVIESVDDGSNVLAVCIEDSKLREIIEIFTSAGLEPKVVTSIDLWLSGGAIDKLFHEPITDSTVRAQAAAEELVNPSINLRQGEHAYTGDLELFKKKLKTSALLGLILFIILGALSSFRLMDAKQEHESLSRQMQEAYKGVFPEDKKIIDLERQFAGNVKALKKRKTILAGIPLLNVMKEVSLKINRKATLIEFNSDGSNIVLKGVASSFEDVEALKDSLSSSFENVKVTSSKATKDEKIDFTIIMKEKTV